MTLNHKPAYPPLLPAFACICGGILTAVFLPATPISGTLTLFALTLAAVASPLRLTMAMTAVSLLAGGWGLMAMSQVLSPEQEGPPLKAFSDGTPYIISGRISSFASPFPRKTRYVLSCETLSTKTSAETFRVTGKIYLSVYKSENALKPSPLLYGTRVRLVAGLKSIRSFANPGGFDYRQFLYFKGITASAWTKREKIEILPSACPPSLWTRLIQGLQKARQRCHHLILSRAGSDGALPTSDSPGLKKDAAAVLSAMIIGQKTGLSHEVRDHFSRIGISHLLAISGLHMSIIGYLSFLLFLQCFRPFPGYVNQGLARKTALALTFIPLSGYAVLAGFSPATQRAMIMAAVLIAAMVIDRETDPINVLCLAGILILALDPAALFSISFQLSFSAVAAIILGMARVNKNGLVPRSKWMARLATAFWVSLFAGLATAPLTARYFNTVSYIFMFSNLIFIPAMGLVCLPLGLGASVALFVYLPLAQGLADLALALVSLCLVPVSILGECPYTWSRVVTPNFVEISLYYLMLAGLLILLSKHKRIGTSCTVIAAAAGLCCISLDMKHRFYPGQLTATVLDVGQGASTLVQTPEGKIILLDCGGFSSGSGFNVGRYVVGPYLWRNRIMAIDLVVLSHPQADHMNGLGFILANFTVKRVIRNQDTSDCKDFHDFLTEIRTQNIPVATPIFPGMALDYGRVRFSFYPARTKSLSDLNYNSLVVHIVFDRFSMLVTGDIDSKRELALCRQPDLALPSRIMLAPHHGSRTASSKIFLDQVNPERVIVSCGYKNRYGFPHFEVLERYQLKKIKVYRTDLHGALTIGSRGGEYQITTHRNN